MLQPSRELRCRASSMARLVLLNESHTILVGTANRGRGCERSSKLNSSANPWLDFLPAQTAHKLARELNDDLESYCSTAPSLANQSVKRLYGFGLLPLVPGASTESLLSTVEQVAALPHLRGIIMGTRGLGNGLDDDALEPLWGALQKAGLVVFLHPHYGLENVWGDKENGHVLPLALGFPLETTIVSSTRIRHKLDHCRRLTILSHRIQATTRMILAGVFDRYPSLRLLLAHSGGALPQLSSRLASCITHDPVVASRLQHDARYYLGKLYLDAVAYGAEELSFVSDAIGRAEKYARPGSSAAVSSAKGTDGTAQRKLGARRMLFGTDHPFFPPLSEKERWTSVVENLEAIDGAYGWDEADKDAVRGGNAVSLFNLGK